MLEEKHNKEQPQSPTKPQESQAAEAAQHPTADNPAPPEENVVPTSQKTESTQPKTQAVSEASTDEQVTIQEREQAQIEESILQPSEDELRRLAFTDELTGLNNRRFMRTRVSSYINFAKQNSSFLCLVMLDLDSFKQINDQHGHMAGDKVLTFFGETLTEHVGRRGIPIRYAGDEFSVVMMEAEKSDAKQMMDSFIEKLQQTPVAVGDDAEVNVGVSIGIAHYPQDASDYDELFKRADEALYHAKGSGKNMVVVYPDEGKLIAPGNISTLFPVEKTVGFDDIIEKLKLLTIDRIVGENAKPEFPILCGPMGSGKTRLLNELRREAEKQGHGVIYVCGKVDQNRPYNALIAAFNDALIKDLPFFKELAGELSYNEKTELTKNIPQLAEIPDPPDDGSSEDRDTVVFKALNKLLFGLLRKARQLLIVDDAHLVDVASLSFIDSFVTEFPNSELDLAFSITTDEDYTSDSAMAHILGGMSKTAQIAEITRLEKNAMENI